MAACFVASYHIPWHTAPVPVHTRSQSTVVAMKESPPDSSVVGFAAASAVIKVGASVATKAAATTAAVLVTGPAFKASAIAATLLQIGYESVRASIKADEVAKRNATLLAARSEAEEAQAERLLLAERQAEAATYAEKIDRCITVLPPVGAPKMAKLLTCTALGAGLGMALPTRWSTKVALIAVAAVATSRYVRSLEPLAQNALNEREQALAVAEQKAMAAAEAAVTAENELKAAMAQ